MNYTTLENVIRQNIKLSSRKNNRGWFSVICKVCNDHGRKGKRGGFRFDGDTVGYNCFNCGHAAMYNPHENKTLPEKMQVVLDAFNVPKEEWQAVVLHSLTFNSNKIHSNVISTNIEPKEIPLPSFFKLLEDDKNDKWAQRAIEYLKEERGINYKDYIFCICTEETKDPESKKWCHRLIIPIFKDDKIVFYQGRDLTGTKPKKYMSPDVPRDNIIHGYEHIHESTNVPLYIVEGWFDAFLINGIAIFGPVLSANQQKWINQSHKQKVVIPDKFGDGWRLAQQAIELGWSVSTPDIGNCADVNEAVTKYGLLYTLKSIKDNTFSGFEAQARVGLYCKKSKTGEKYNGTRKRN